MQKIYDDKNYLKFCILFEEEKKYKEYNTTELKDITKKLKKIMGENDDEDELWLQIVVTNHIPSSI